jgi:hypothetical protein
MLQKVRRLRFIVRRSPAADSPHGEVRFERRTFPAKWRGQTGRNHTLGKDLQEGSVREAMTAFQDPKTAGREGASADPGRTDPPHGGMAQVSQVSDSAQPPGSVGLAKRPWARNPLDGPGPDGPIERVMSTVIRKLAWSRLSNPKVALSVSAVGLFLGMLVGLNAPNQMALGHEGDVIALPLTRAFQSIFPWMQTFFYDHLVFSGAVLYAGDVLACLGLAGMLWAHSQGWRPNPTKLFLLSTGIVAVMVSITPVGSSDTASYAAYGRIAALGQNPYAVTPAQFFHKSGAYYNVIGELWTHTQSVYGPIATGIQSAAAHVGGANVSHTIWLLMILNGLVFVGVGFLLLKTSDDPVRATLFWTANPVLIQQLVSGGHLDTFVAAAAICAVQVARRVSGKWGDVLIGVLIGVACGVKATAVLVGIGLALPLLMRREWMRLARMTAVSLLTVGAIYSYYGLSALKPLLTQGTSTVQLPSPWWFLDAFWVHVLGFSSGTASHIITVLWPLAMIAVAWLISQRISSDQPREVVGPFAVSFAWILVAPWSMAWYAALAWVTATQLPRNRMTRWLAIVTVVLALWHSSGGSFYPNP